MSEISAPRGVYDILPQETEQWQRLESGLKHVVQRAGYKEIRIPIFEHTELFKRGVGETTDIVNKEMYTFCDKSQRSLTLRPEGTAGVVRAYLNNGMHRLAPPVKLWYLGPMFRYERMQTGRQRQFHQIGVEALGSAGPAIDAEVIQIAQDCLKAAGVTEFKLLLNSIGCQVCRPKFRDLLREALQSKLEQLCHDCKDRFERNPLRMLDCKIETCQAHYKNLPSTLKNLCDECSKHWQGLLALLAKLGIETEIQDRLVRGLDYYSRTVFEFVSSDKRLGAQATLLAGGRYDYLIETLGGQPTPAVGWALGLERLFLLSDKVQAAGPVAFVVATDSAVALATATKLRQQGITCELDFPLDGDAVRNFGRQLQQANKFGARWVVIQGEDEQQSGEVTIKNMTSGEQSRLSLEGLLGFFKERL